MCIAIPAKVTGVSQHEAVVDIMGNTKRVNIDLVAEQLEPGDYVLVHAGYAMDKIDKVTAIETLALFEEAINQSEY